MNQIRLSKLVCLLVLSYLLFLANWSYSQNAGAAPAPASSPWESGQGAPPTSKPLPDPNPKPSKEPPPSQPATFEANLTGVEVKDASKEHSNHQVALGKFVVLTFDQPWAAILKQQTSANHLGLFINDLFMKGLEPMPIPDQPNSVMFQLLRNSDNRPAWSVLFGRKSFGISSAKGTCSEDERIKLTVGLQDGSWGAKGPQILCLEYLPDWKTQAVLFISFFVALFTVILGFKSSMLRDSGDPRKDGKPGTYSLGRCQMALWFVTVVFAFLFTYAVSGDTSPVPQGTLILMGIGAGTALGAAAIDLNKRTATRADLINWTAEKVSLPQQIQDLQAKIAATPPADPNLPILQQQLLTAQQRLVAVSAQLAQIPATEVPASEGFIRDVLSDANGIGFHRLQVFGWTFVFWAVFVATLFKTVTMTDFDTTQLALMGISGSTYLAFKLQEKQA